ncbi:MAG: hypothetical protein ACRBB6_09055 [Neptuniibacter sp.]
MSNTVYRLDKSLLEKKTTLFTNMQMFFVGTALMLMMMDLSKIYLLAPLGAGLILVSWYKSQFNNIHEEFKDTSVEMAPKSLLIKKPAMDFEQRVTFREIEEITQHRQNFIPMVTLYLRDNLGKIELPALEKVNEFIYELNNAVQDRN